MKAFRLLDLSAELLLMVLSSCDKSTLFQLSLVSRKIGQCATTKLYSELIVLMPGSLSPRVPITITLAHLAYLVFTSPEHASYVRSIEDSGLFWRRTCPKYLKKTPKSETREPEQARNLEKALKHKCEEYSIPEAEATNTDVVLQFVIASLPKLQRLDISVGSTSCFIPRIFRSTRGSETTNVAGNKNSSTSDLDRRSCALRHINFEVVTMHPQDLSHMLGVAMPGKLKSFEYNIIREENIPLTGLPAMEGFEAHHNTLESLTLNHRNYFGSTLEELPSNIQKSCGRSFVGSSALRCLKVAPVFIWGQQDLPVDLERRNNPKQPETLWRALPRTLEELWITNTNGFGVHPVTETPEEEKDRFIADDLIPALASAIENKPEAYPNLGRFTLQIQIQDWKMEWLNALASTLIKMEESEICCTIICDDLSSMNNDRGLTDLRTQFEERGVTWTLQNGQAREWKALNIAVAEERHLATRLRLISKKVTALPLGPHW
jgi:hypothetical protein